MRRGTTCGTACGETKGLADISPGCAVSTRSVASDAARVPGGPDGFRQDEAEPSPTVTTFHGISPARAPEHGGAR